MKVSLQVCTECVKLRSVAELASTLFGIGVPISAHTHTLINQPLSMRVSCAMYGLTDNKRRGEGMTRCKHCGYSFAQENGWQDYCSQECAMLYHCGMIIPCGITINDSVNRKLKQAIKSWHEFLADERNLKLVRWGGERAKPPQVGKFEQRIYRYLDDDGKWHEHSVMVNVGSEIKPRAITTTEYEAVIKRRGRASFGENMVENQVWRDLPSVHGRVGLGWFPHN